MAYNPKTTAYDAADVSLVVGPKGSTFNVTGFGEDMITWEKQEAFFEPSVGAQGDVVVNETNNNLYDLTITLQSTSPALKKLYKYMQNKTEISVKGTNKKLGVKFGGSAARVVEAPELSFGAEAEDVEVKITVFNGYTEYN